MGKPLYQPRISYENQERVLIPVLFYVLAPLFFFFLGMLGLSYLSFGDPYEVYGLSRPVYRILIGIVFTAMYFLLLHKSRVYSIRNRRFNR